MTKQISNHASAAKMIRAELKKHNIKGRVRASTASMTSSVDVYLDECQPPWVMKAVEIFANRFQYGHFDGMTDCYEYSNTNDDLPQVRFVFVHNQCSNDDRQKAYDFLKANFASYSDAPENYEDAQNEMYGSEWVSTEVHQVLTGCMDSRIAGNLRFWNKPVVSLTNV